MQLDIAQNGLNWNTEESKIWESLLVGNPYKYGTIEKVNERVLSNRD